MITKEEAKERVKQLVKEFSEIPKSYLDTMPEEDIKRLFITPLLEALGWNKFDILSESRVLRGCADYLLKIGSSGVLVVEAKKTSVSLSEDEGRQAVSYAYHSKIKFAVLTNFKRLRVYHALSNIKDIDRNLLKIGNNPFRLEFEEYLEKFDWLWLLSKESFQNGEINKLLSAKDERINKPIDKKLLEDLLKIREWLSKELKSKRNDLDDGIIDEIIQILIDRLIFIRSVEDRGLEGSGFLLGLSQSVKKQEIRLQMFPYLLEKFIYLNRKYDSKLFEPGLVEKEGAFSDEILHKVIKALYFGVEDIQSKYMFDQIPGDIFGNIYEQYLGTILAGTGKRVKLDSESGKRKKMGIYYTPSYIVDYIVKNTVGEYIKNKTIDEILDVRILDPACGSGSFLTRAFLEICDRVEELLKSGEKSEKATFKNYKDRLFLAQKATILTNCIYGVDLDEKAVELARLNLLLKALEGEGPDSRTFLLPHLSNIKCGNSLIDDPKIAKDKAFNWKAQFPDVFSKGGFDIVVGNPPYGFRQMHSKNIKQFYKKNYYSSQGSFEYYFLFYEKSLKLIKEGGMHGFIVPVTWLTIPSAKSLRKFILNNYWLKEINWLPEFVFEDAKVNTLISIIQRSEPTFTKVNIYDSLYFIKPPKDEKKLPQQKFVDSDYSINIFQSNLDDKILTKINNSSKHLIEFARPCSGYNPYEVGKGMSPSGGKQKLKDVEEKPYHSIKKINSGWKAEIVGRNLNRYNINLTGNRWIKYGPWLAAPRDPNNFLGKRILIQEITGGKDKRIIAAFYEGELYHSRDIIPIKIEKDDIESFCLLAIINSKLISWYHHKNSPKAQKGLFPKVLVSDIEKIPIKIPISLPQQKKIVDLVNQMLELQKRYHNENNTGNEKDRLKQQITNTDYEIDQEVYKLYGITDEEKKIIEASLK